MLKSFRGISFLKNAGYFTTFSCNQSKPLVFHFFPPKGFSLAPVALFHGTPYFSNASSELFEKSVSQSSKPQYVKDLYHETKIEDVLMAIKENQTQELISVIINKIYLILKEKPLTKRLLQKTRSTPQFKTFIRLIKVNDLKYQDLMILLEVLQKMYVPHTHHIYKQIISKTLEIHKSLDFYEIVAVHHFLNEKYESKHEACERLASVLKEEINGMLEDRYFLSLPKNKTAALQYSLHNPVSDEIQRIISDTISTFKPEELLHIFQYLCKFLSETPSTHSSYKTIKANFIQIVDNNLAKSLPLSSVMNFTTIYASEVKNHNINYDPELVDYFVNVAVKFNAKNYELAQILKSSSLLRHVNCDLLTYAIHVVKTDSNFGKEYPLAYQFLISLLANSNCSHEIKQKWNKVVSFLANSDGLTNCLEIKKSTEMDFLFIVAELASLGIFHDESLFFLSKSIGRHEIMNKTPGYLYMLLILNQAVKILNSTYKRPFLEDDALKSVLNQIEPHYAVMLKRKLVTLHEVKDCFDSVLGTNDSMLLEIHTKLGTLIDGVLAISDDGTAYSLGSMVKSSHKKTFIEEITVPVNYKMCAVFLFGQKEYWKSSCTVIASRALLLTTLEAMGFRTIVILDDVWNSLNTEQKESFLRKEISKNNE